MAQGQLSILAPDWSQPQWKAIEKNLGSQNIALRIDWVRAEEIAADFAKRRKSGDLPDIVMLPTESPNCETTPEFRVLHEIANRLDEQGLAIVETDLGVAIGVVPLWAYAWSLYTTKLDPGVEPVLVAAGQYRDPKVPSSPVWRTSLLFHEQTFKLPKKLGGFEFSIHFPGTINLDVIADKANPNRGTIRIRDLEGVLPVAALWFLDKLPWPKKWNVDKECDAFSMQLHEPHGAAQNGGTIDFQTGETVLTLSVRVSAPFFEPVGMDTMDMVIEEHGRWDRLAGTLYVETGTVTLIGGLFDGMQIALLNSSKNERQTIKTNCTAEWQPLKVEILQYGTTPESEPDLEQLRELFEQLSSSGARFASLIAAAISVSRARSVFVTYVCVKTETFQAQQKKDGEWQNDGDPFDRTTVMSPKRVALPDIDALLWWQQGNPPSSEISAALSRNKPRSGCSCP